MAQEGPVCRLSAEQVRLINEFKPEVLEERRGAFDWDRDERVIKALRPAGFAYIGAGAFRAAYKFPGEKAEKCVVKVAHGPAGMRHQRTEAETWEKAPPDLKKHLVPVHSASEDGWWLTMPLVKRFTNLDREDFSAAEKARAATIQALAKDGWACDDLHTGNIGRSGSRPVALDYGFGCERLSERKPAPWMVDRPAGRLQAGRERRKWLGSWF